MSEPLPIAEDDAGTCKCGAPAGEPGPCPYASEIRGDDSPCSCCRECATECAMEI